MAHPCFGLEYAQIDGPWLLDENYDKRNGLLSTAAARVKTGNSSITAQACESDWRSTDQIPLRAVRARRDRSLRFHRSYQRRPHRIAIAWRRDWSSSLGNGYHDRPCSMPSTTVSI